MSPYAYLPIPLTIKERIENNLAKQNAAASPLVSPRGTGCVSPIARAFISVDAAKASARQVRRPRRAVCVCVLCVPTPRTALTRLPACPPCRVAVHCMHMFIQAHANARTRSGHAAAVAAAAAAAGAANSSGGELDTDSSDDDAQGDAENGVETEPVSPIDRIRAKLIRTSARLDAARKVAASARSSPDGTGRVAAAAASSAARRLEVEAQHESDFVEVAERVAASPPRMTQNETPPRALTPPPQFPMAPLATGTAPPLLSAADADELAFKSEVAAALAARKRAAAAARARVRAERQKQTAAANAKKERAAEERNRLDERLKSKHADKKEAQRAAKSARRTKLLRAQNAARARQAAASALRAKSGAPAAETATATTRARRRVKATGRRGSATAKRRGHQEQHRSNAKTASGTAAAAASAAGAGAPIATQQPRPPPVIETHPPPAPPPPHLGSVLNPLPVPPPRKARSPMRLLQPGVDIATLTYYELLGVKTRASQDKLRKAYRKLARVYHPDKNPACAPDGEAPGLFTEITRAYQTLSEPESRMQYDHTRLAARQSARHARAARGRRGSASASASASRPRGAAARRAKKAKPAHRAKSDWA